MAVWSALSSRSGSIPACPGLDVLEDGQDEVGELLGVRHAQPFGDRVRGDRVLLVPA